MDDDYKEMQYSTAEDAEISLKGGFLLISYSETILDFQKYSKNRTSCHAPLTQPHLMLKSCITSAQLSKPRN